MGRKTFEKAGGLNEEILYIYLNCHFFSNFDYEMKKFNKKIVNCFMLDEATILCLAGAICGLIFYKYSTFVVAFLYRRIIFYNEKNSNIGKPLTGGNVMTYFFTFMAIMSNGLIDPNLKIIQETCIASSEHFPLFERKPEIDLIYSCNKPFRESIRGKIEFKNVFFHIMILIIDKF